MKPVAPPAVPQENWGELGPAMQALNEKQRDFVRYLVTEPATRGYLTRAYKKAGYGKNSKAGSDPHTLSKDAHRLSRDERIIAAIAEESRKVIRVGHPEAVAALFEVMRERTTGTERARSTNPKPRRPAADQAFSRRHSPDEDPDRAALEELRAPQARRATREAPRTVRPKRARPPGDIGSCRNCAARRPGQDHRRQSHRARDHQWMTTHRIRKRSCASPGRQFIVGIPQEIPSGRFLGPERMVRAAAEVLCGRQAASPALDPRRQPDRQNVLLRV